MWYLVQLCDKMLCDGRNSNWCDCEAQNNHVSKVGGRKTKESTLLINTWIIQDKIGGGKS